MATAEQYLLLSTSTASCSNTLETAEHFKSLQFPKCMMTIEIA